MHTVPVAPVLHVPSEEPLEGYREKLEETELSSRPYLLLCIHGAVMVELFKEYLDALVGVVEQRVLEGFHLSLRLEPLVDPSFPGAAPLPVEPKLVLGVPPPVLDPSAENELFPGHPSGGIAIALFPFEKIEYLFCKLPFHLLVRVEVENPGMLRPGICKVPLSGEVSWPGIRDDPGAQAVGEIAGPVGASRIDHDDFICEPGGVDAPGDSFGLIFRENDHRYVGFSGSAHIPAPKMAFLTFLAASSTMYQ